MITTELLIGPRIKRISNAMDRKRNMDLEDVELTSSQGMVLGYLARRQGEAVYPGDVGKHFGLTHPTVTGILQRLEAKGYVAYEPDPADRRKKRVVPTEKALECHARIRARFVETEHLITKGMTPGELEELVRLLDGVIERLNAGCGMCGSNHNAAPDKETTEGRNPGV